MTDQPPHKATLRPARLLAVALLALTLAACGGKGNHDPRKGRVYTHREDCLTGGCIADWKVCVGPDLLVHIDGAKHDYLLKNDRECQP